VLSKLLAALAILALPPLAAYAGWLFTENWFKTRLVPLPFEPSGMAVGAGCFLWTLSLLILLVAKKNGSKRSPLKGDKP
jgi:hypothetical protein